jgi:hypothetical protein
MPRHVSPDVPTVLLVESATDDRTMYAELLDEHLLNRIRAEFMEMPGLQLTDKQVQRLCGVERTVCQLVLDALVEMRFLSVKVDGTYARLTDGAERVRPQPPTAERRNDG